MVRAEQKTFRTDAWNRKTELDTISTDGDLTYLINVATIMIMEIEFDPEKNARNVRDRGISFDQAQEFDWDSALVWSDTRQDYGEERFIALGLIGERLHSLVFTVRGNAVRVISLRKANRREELGYEQENKS